MLREFSKNSRFQATFALPNHIDHIYQIDHIKHIGHISQFDHIQKKCLKK